MDTTYTVYITNICKQPSWDLFFQIYRTNRLLRLCYTDITVINDGRTTFKLYAQFAHPISVTNLRKILQNETDEADVTVVACNHDFMAIQAYRSCLHKWIHLNKNDGFQ